MVLERSPRVPVEIETEIVLSQNKKFDGLIENLSDEGVCVTFDAHENIDFTRGSTLNLEFQPPFGEFLNLHCQIMRAHTIPPNSFSYNVGLKILETPLEYEEFFKILYMRNMRMI
jgi:hypothetical protein